MSAMFSPFLSLAGGPTTRSERQTPLAGEAAVSAGCGLGPNLDTHVG